MALTTTQKLLGRVAGVIGVLQGITWTSLSLTCIILYHSEYTIKDQPTNYSQYLNMLLTGYYLNKNEELDNSRVIRSNDFIIILWFYFFFSVAMLASSADLLYAIQRNKTRQSNLMLLWGCLTCSISIIDFVLTALLLRDFLNCPLTNGYCQTVVGIVMTMAARGFALWALNVFLSYGLVSSALQIITHNKVKDTIHDLTIPRARLPGHSHLNYPPTPNGNQSPTVQNGQNEFPSFMKNGSNNKFVY